MTPPSARVPALGESGLRDIEASLATTGLFLDLGLARMRVRSELPSLAAQLKAVYRHFPLQTQSDWADLHVDMLRGSGIRRWVRPQLRFLCDGPTPFDPFPAGAGLPLLEWGANWLIGRRFNDVLLLHAGVVERGGLALVMPAMPGSGKSTLTAALSLSGWRLLSDEFGALDLATGGLRPVLKPVGLKNQSIAVIRDFAAGVELGPEFPKTRKGTVAHLAPSRDAVSRVHETAQPGAIMLPRWQAGAATRLEPMAPHLAFSALAFNAFNYAVCGGAGFKAVVAMTQSCPTWQLVYSDLGDALRTIDAEWPAIVERAQRRQALDAETAGGVA